ncbi:hypothetical protein P7C73_g34, partial [Tremellales sp. Uapishka_1]
MPDLRDHGDRTGPSQALALPSLPSPNSSTMALLSISQDIAAVLSLTIEASLSLVHGCYRSVLGTMGLGGLRAEIKRGKGRCEDGRGLGVVVVGAGEATGQSLTLHLARSGYTVFPFLPLPTPNSPPTSQALSHLLLTWSGIQKRLRARYPNHPGSVVPVITDPENHLYFNLEDERKRSRFSHAGETVRAYCRENKLVLIAIVCSPRTLRKHHPTIPREIAATLPSNALTLTDEQTLLSLYRSNILDPLCVIRELSDLLSSQNGRIVFVGGKGGGEMEEDDERLENALSMITVARNEAGRLLRGELGGLGIEVCEVLVGPMSPRIGTPGYHIRHSSDESNPSLRGVPLLDQGEGMDIDESDIQIREIPEDLIVPQHSSAQDAILAQRLNLLSRIWAVDDALLYSAVRRAIQDRYPRYKHHAGISPFLASISEITPGSGMLKVIGRWLVGRLLRPKRK